MALRTVYQYERHVKATMHASPRIPTSSNDDNKQVDEEFTIDIQYKNNLEGQEQTMSFTYDREDGMTSDNIYETSFWDEANEWMHELDVDVFAIEEVVDVIAEAYVDMIEQVNSEDRRSLAMVVNIEVDELGQDEGTMVAEEQEGEVVKVVFDNVAEARAFLAYSGVTFGSVSALLASNRALPSCCAICLDEALRPDVEVARLPCSHVFHGCCFMKFVMLKGNATTCPLCRAELVKSS